jgi:predicted O-methyltransferase YrrM
VLEVGSWAGASAITWAKALKSQLINGTVDCVDPWMPYFDETVQQEKKYKLMNDAARDGSIFELFKQNIRVAEVDDIVRYHRGTSREILPKLSDARFHIVYIDGSHLYEDVLFDLKEARRLLADGGVLCGDDLELQLSEVDLADHKVALDEKKDVSVGTQSKAAYHPGVTQAVAELFSDVSAWEGFWATRRMGGAWEKVNLDISGISVPGHLKGLPVFMEVYNQYNLFAVGERVLAIRQRLGPIDLACSEKELTERYDCRDLFFVPSRDDAEFRIDMFQLEQVGQSLSERLADSERVVRDLSGRLADSERVVRDLSGRLADSERVVRDLSGWLARLERSIIFRLLRRLQLV